MLGVENENNRKPTAIPVGDGLRFSDTRINSHFEIVAQASENYLAQMFTCFSPQISNREEESYHFPETNQK